MAYEGASAPVPPSAPVRAAAPVARAEALACSLLAEEAEEEEEEEEEAALAAGLLTATTLVLADDGGAAANARAKRRRVGTAGRARARAGGAPRGASQIASLLGDADALRALASPLRALAASPSGRTLQMKVLAALLADLVEAHEQEEEEACEEALAAVLIIATGLLL